jgi:high-affinity nickel-transport protein
MQTTTARAIPPRARRQCTGERLSKHVPDETRVNDVLLNPFDDDPSRIRFKAAVTFTILVAINVAAWSWALVIFAGQPTLIGTAALAYMFGLRHAFDADHIAAIDNVVRKLMQDGKAPFSVGFFFSMGHSSVVILASLVIALSAAAAKDRFAEFHHVGGIVGTGISAVFLLTIGVANLVILRGTWRAFERTRAGAAIAADDLDMLTAGNGVLARFFRPAFRMVSRSWHMYPLGVLFGLGFDTATEVGLLGMAAAQATQGLSMAAILVFPALFTAGMSLMDTADSVLMTRAYGWAFINPVRKLWYNLTLTATSVIVAIFIGGLEALGLFADKLGLNGGVWSVVVGLNGDLVNFGYVVVGSFALSWIASMLIWRARGYDDLPAGQTQRL